MIPHIAGKTSEKCSKTAIKIHHAFSRVKITEVQSFDLFRMCWEMLGVIKVVRNHGEYISGNLMIREKIMKTFRYILLVVAIGGTGISEVSAQGETAVLCGMHASSLLDPWNFDAVIAAERNQFDGAMISYVQNRMATLEKSAREYDQYCEQFRYNPPQYTQCRGNNRARELVVWLGSVMQGVNGSSWSQTQFGNQQIASWNQCEVMGLFNCSQMRQQGANQSRRECPSWL